MSELCYRHHKRLHCNRGSYKINGMNLNHLHYSMRSLHWFDRLYGTNLFDYFSEQILSGELKINDKILPEREIAEKLDVSRNSIREVMHMLEINGLLDCRQGSGNYIRCEPQEYMIQFMNMVMALHKIEYTEVYDIRMGYETVALRLAIKNATEEEIEQLHQILIKMDEVEDPKESGRLDMEFHNKLIAASHNRLIVLYSSMIAELMNRFISDFRVRIMADPRQAEALRLSLIHISEPTRP